MSEWNFIIAAYAVAWVGLGGYALYLRSRAARVREAWDRSLEENGR